MDGPAILLMMQKDGRKERMQWVRGGWMMTAGMHRWMKTREGGKINMGVCSNGSMDGQMDDG